MTVFYPNPPVFTPTRQEGPSISELANRVTLDDLAIKVEKQNLLIQTLLHLLIKKKAIDEQEFKQWMEYVDDFDGRSDGRLAAMSGIKPCPSCKRVNRGDAAKCQYCAAEFPTEFLVRPNS